MTAAEASYCGTGNTSAVVRELLDELLHPGEDTEAPDMLRLLVEGFPSQPSPILAEHGTAVWGRSSPPAARTPTRPLARKPTQAQTHAGYLTSADTTVRPQAISAAIRYALWQRRIASDAEISPVLAVLDHHVDHWQDPSPTVHFVSSSNAHWRQAQCAPTPRSTFPPGSAVTLAASQVMGLPDVTRVNAAAPSLDLNIHSWR